MNERTDIASNRQRASIIMRSKSELQLTCFVFFLGLALIFSISMTAYPGYVNAANCAQRIQQCEKKISQLQDQKSKLLKDARRLAEQRSDIRHEYAPVQKALSDIKFMRNTLRDYRAELDAKARAGGGKVTYQSDGRAIGLSGSRRAVVAMDIYNAQLKRFQPTLKHEKKLNKEAKAFQKKLDKLNKQIAKVDKKSAALEKKIEAQKKKCKKLAKDCQSKGKQPTKKKASGSSQKAGDAGILDVSPFSASKRPVKADAGSGYGGYDNGGTESSASGYSGSSGYDDAKNSGKKSVAKKPRKKDTSNAARPGKKSTTGDDYWLKFHGVILNTILKGPPKDRGKEICPACLHWLADYRHSMYDIVEALSNENNLMRELRDLEKEDSSGYTVQHKQRLKGEIKDVNRLLRDARKADEKAEHKEDISYAKLIDCYKKHCVKKGKPKKKVSRIGEGHPKTSSNLQISPEGTFRARGDTVLIDDCLFTQPKLSNYRKGLDDMPDDIPELPGAIFGESYDHSTGKSFHMGSKTSPASLKSSYKKQLQKNGWTILKEDVLDTQLGQFQRLFAKTKNACISVVAAKAPAGMPHKSVLAIYTYPGPGKYKALGGKDIKVSTGYVKDKFSQPKGKKKAAMGVARGAGEVISNAFGAIGECKECAALFKEYMAISQKVADLEERGAHEAAPDSPLTAMEPSEFKQRRALKKKLEACLKKCEAQKKPAAKKPEKIALPPDKGVCIPGANDITNPIIRDMPASESTTNKAKSAIGGFAKGALGGMFGGSGWGVFGGGGGHKKSGASLVRRPKGPWDKLGIDPLELKLGGWVYRDQIRIAQRITDSPDNGGPDSMWLQDANGNVLHPLGYMVFELWRHWKLTITITRDTWVNGEHTSHSVNRESTEWKELVDRYKVLLEAPSIWEQLQSRPFDQLKGVIVEFSLPKNFDPTKWSLITHITSKARESGREVIKTVPLVVEMHWGKKYKRLRFQPSSDGKTLYHRFNPDCL